MDEKNVYGGTALHYACSKGHSEVIGILLANGADIEARTNSGWTPLHTAAAKGFDKAVKVLLGNGANSASQNNAKRTPIEVCTNDAVKVVLQGHARRSKSSSMMVDFPVSSLATISSQPSLVLPSKPKPRLFFFLSFFLSFFSFFFPFLFLLIDPICFIQNPRVIMIRWE